MLAQVYRGLGDAAAEQATLEKMAGLSSDSVSAYKRLAEIHAATENWSEVLRNAERMIDVNPLLGEGQEFLALAAERLGQPDRAIAALSALSEMDPLDPALLHFRLAQALTENQQPNRARRQVLKALEQAPRYRAAQKLLLQLVQEPESTPESPDATTP